MFNYRKHCKHYKQNKRVSCICEMSGNRTIFLLGEILRSLTLTKTCTVRALLFKLTIRKDGDCNGISPFKRYRGEKRCYSFEAEHKGNARAKEKCVERKYKKLFLVETGQEYSEGNLTKKWSNIQIRVKDTLRDGKQTGGAIRRSSSEPDEVCIRIFDENNPKLAQIPGGFHNTEEVGTSSSQVGGESRQSRSGK